MKNKKFLFQIDKISIAEMISNTETGKTSGSGFIGVLCGVIGNLFFMVSSVMFLVGRESAIDIVDHSVWIIGISAVLLGARKFMNNKRLGPLKDSDEIKEKQSSSEGEKEQSVEFGSVLKQGVEEL